MPNFRRYYVPNAIYFIVAVTRERRPIFAEDANADSLYNVIRQVRRIKPFSLLAHSLIPDHVNLLIEPTGEANISRIMLSIQRTFTLAYKRAHGIASSLSLWQPRFWDHITRDENDLKRHLDYIHYNPVKHGFVARPEDYPYSSYRYWLEKGYYEDGWGHSEPENVRGMDFEGRGRQVGRCDRWSARVGSAGVWIRFWKQPAYAAANLPYDCYLPSKKEVPMNLLDLTHRTAIPEPWAEGDKIPWNDPGFSERMLREHLSQEHDAASRRFEKIDAHVAWIHHELLSGHPTRILDLGCGPGLYASRLARLGHECVGIDFSPASIAYARDIAAQEGLHCTYLQQDVRAADYGAAGHGAGFGLVMFIYGELNVFCPADAERILRKARAALAGGGLLLLEVQTFDSLKRWGEQGPSWYAAASGLFSAQPHLCLEEHFWDAGRGVATIRHFVVDAATGGVTRHAASHQTHRDDEYRALLVECGFAGVTFHPSLTGAVDESQRDFFAIVARRG